MIGNWVFVHLSTVCCAVDISLVLQNGDTALMVASGAGRTDIVQLILDHGAQVDLQNSVRELGCMCFFSCLIVTLWLLD